MAEKRLGNLGVDPKTDFSRGIPAILKKIPARFFPCPTARFSFPAGAR
jgi:hypothetical protein